MVNIEIYSDNEAAIAARDHYNHNLQKRAVVAQFPGSAVDDYRSNQDEEIFSKNITKTVWILFFEDQ